MSKFYDKLTNLCAKKGVSKIQMVRDLDMSSGNLSAWKNGAEPSTKSLYAICNYFGVEARELIDNAPDFYDSGKENTVDENYMKDLQYVLQKVSVLSKQELAVVAEMIRMILK